MRGSAAHVSVRPHPCDPPAHAATTAATTAASAPAGAAVHPESSRPVPASNPGPAGTARADAATTDAPPLASPARPEATAICAASAGRLEVYYDGGCPLCRREIGFLRARRGADRIDWIDLAARVEPEVVPGLARCDALARMHVRTADGQLVSGAAAFAALWRALPLTRPLGWACSWPPLLRVLEAAYVRFLRWRPRLQAWVVRRTGEGEAAGPRPTDPGLTPPTASSATPPSASGRRA
jgi:predicted DCC family thiol-disulfide oxidoreductase YuxK